MAAGGGGVQNIELSHGYRPLIITLPPPWVLVIRLICSSPSVICCKHAGSSVALSVSSPLCHITTPHPTRHTLSFFNTPHKEKEKKGCAELTSFEFIRIHPHMLIFLRRSSLPFRRTRQSASRCLQRTGQDDSSGHDSPPLFLPKRPAASRRYTQAPRPTLPTFAIRNQSSLSLFGP